MKSKSAIEEWQEAQPRHRQCVLLSLLRGLGAAVQEAALDSQFGFDELRGNVLLIARTYEIAIKLLNDGKLPGDETELKLAGGDEK